ncbi:MAG: hypothetical protein IKW90_09160 [Lachnospiraceae bacterium]|nr:hypothetical protein [Lachnospiraceae bacterium]
MSDIHIFGAGTAKDLMPSEEFHEKMMKLASPHWDDFTLIPHLRTPIQLSIREELEEGKDKDGQTYENIAIEYLTMGYRVGDDSYEIIIPEHPERNIDDLWSTGNAFVRSNKEGDKYLVGNGSEGSRWLELKAWKVLG